MTIVGQKMATSRVILVVGVLVVLQFTGIQIVKCQVSDGDEQFQAYHQDIGRISASNSPVAADTTIRQQSPATVTVEPLAAPVAPAPALPARVTQVFDRSAASITRGRQQQQRHEQQFASAPKRNRITLAVRPREPIAAPTTTLLDLPPPPQPLEPQAQPHFHHQPLHQQQPQEQAASQLVAPPAQLQSQPQQFHSQFQPLVPAEPVNQMRSHQSSVSARHSALIAQVAAERQAAEANNFAQTQPSLGTPIEALSSPSVSQVQPPPSAAASGNFANFANQPEEPLVAPSFEQVLSSGCPGKGVFSYENKDHCDRYYMCTNGTFTEEACPNGLAYSQMGAVYQHCAYNWNVDCGTKKTAEPLASPGCPWQFGIFPITAAGRCSIDYFVCEWGVPETKRCSPEGLFYDERIKGCQWADQLGCKSEALLNFKCPPEDEDNPYWPFPRYYHTNKDVIVCVNEQPRLVHCNEDQLVDASSLACIDLKKKKKKF